MPAVTDLANDAAAVSAGYSSQAIDMGASYPAAVRFRREYRKHLVGAAGTNPAHEMKATGEGSSQGAADTVALAALNAQRRHYNGGAPGRSSGSNSGTSGRGGAFTTIDTN